MTNYIKRILENYKGKTINIEKIKRVLSLNEIKIKNLYIKKMIYKHTIYYFNAVYVYKNIYVFYRPTKLQIYDIKNNIYYYYIIGWDYKYNNIINSRLHKIYIWKKQYLEFRGYHDNKLLFLRMYNCDKYLFTIFDKKKLINFKYDKYKANNRLIYIFGI